MPFVEDYQEFAKRQACNSIKLENGTVLFENGAQWIKQSFDGNERYTTRMEPPTEKFALLRAKRLYIRANQAREAAAYQRALTEYQEQAKLAAKYPETCPAVPAGAMKSLKDGWIVLERIAAELDAIDRQLNEAPEAIERRAESERLAKVATERQRIADAFCSLGINSPPPTQDIVEVVSDYFETSKS